MQQSCESFCATLRRLVQEATDRRWSKQAVFFADKLVTISSTQEDVYLLAQALYDNAQYRRAISLLRKHGLTLRNHKFACLTGRCLLGCKAYEECLTTIGGEEDHMEPNISGSDQQIEWIASLYVIRGRAWEELENAKHAVMWYKKALKADPYCYEAYDSLMVRSMLPKSSEDRLLRSMPCNGDNEWIRVLYKCLGNKYGDFDEGVERLRAIVGFTESVAPLRPSDQANRSRVSITDSIHSSPLGNYDQTENMEMEIVERQRYGLHNSIDIKIARAEWHYSRGANIEAYRITSRLIKKDPAVLEIYPVHLAACLELDKKPELYIRGQDLFKIAPKSALCEYAFGVYYLSIKNYTEARKAFGRANKINRYFAPAWIGLGNAFTALSGTEQAMIAYRKAQSLFPGLHLPSVYIGMEKLRLNMLDSAYSDFENAYQLCPGDPTSSNQLGMVEFLRKNYESATEWFQRAINRIPVRESGIHWEATHLNLGHALRKQKRYDDALRAYQTALGFRPRQAGTLTAIGFVYHLQNRRRKAIDHYQLALMYDSHDSFAKEMLQIAANEALGVPEDLFHL